MISRTPTRIQTGDRIRSPWGFTANDGVIVSECTPVEDGWQVILKGKMFDTPLTIYRTDLWRWELLGRTDPNGTVRQEAMPL